MQIWIFLLTRDKIIWSFTLHGQFTFNCAYSVASEAKTIGNKKKPFLVSTVEDQNFKNHIKVFAWRACHNAITKMSVVEKLLEQLH